MTAAAGVITGAVGPAPVVPGLASAPALVIPVLAPVPAVVIPLLAPGAPAGREQRQALTAADAFGSLRGGAAEQRKTAGSHVGATCDCQRATAAKVGSAMTDRPQLLEASTRGRTSQK